MEQKAAALIALANSCDATELDQTTKLQIQQLVTLILASSRGRVAGQSGAVPTANAAPAMSDPGTANRP